MGADHIISSQIQTDFFNEGKHQFSFVLLESVSFDWPPHCCCAHMQL